MHLSIASPTPPTWGIYGDMVGYLFWFAYPICGATVGICSLTLSIYFKPGKKGENLITTHINPQGGRWGESRALHRDLLQR